MSDDLSKVGTVTLTADQVAMLRNVLAAIVGCVGSTIGHVTVFVPSHLVQAARDALALLPEPVDADREEAKKIAAEWYSEEAPHIDPLTAALKRGRELAQKMQSLRRDESEQMTRDLTRALERDSREG